MNFYDNCYGRIGLLQRQIPLQCSCTGAVVPASMARLSEGAGPGMRVAAVAVAGSYVIGCRELGASRLIDCDPTFKYHKLTRCSYVYMRKGGSPYFLHLVSLCFICVMSDSYPRNSYHLQTFYTASNSSIYLQQSSRCQLHGCARPLSRPRRNQSTPHTCLDPRCGPTTHELFHACDDSIFVI